MMAATHWAVENAPLAIRQALRQAQDGLRASGIEASISPFVVSLSDHERSSRVYTARCWQSGDWENTAVAGAANLGPREAVVTVVCA
jgi:hypothetical protein